MGGDRAFAVGAGNVHDGRQLLVRTTELAEQPLDATEREVDQQRMQQFHLGEELGARLHAALAPVPPPRPARARRRTPPAVPLTPPARAEKANGARQSRTARATAMQEPRPSVLSVFGE